MNTVLFKPGQVVATPGALEALERSGQSVWHFLALHLAGSWGDAWTPRIEPPMTKP